MPYPDELPNLSTASANDDTAEDTHPALHNDANAAINQIAAELGTNPAGSEDTVADRIGEVEGGLSDHMSDSSAAHAASAISYAGGTGMSATDVEAAIDELATEKANAADVATDTELSNHASDTTSVHGIVDTSDLVLDDDARLPTADQRAALAGTSGTPGDGNRYVTNSDARNTDAREPTAHSHPTGDVTGLDDVLATKADLAEAVEEVAASGDLVEVDLDAGTVWAVTLTDDCDLVLPAPVAGRSLTVALRQDGTGGRATTWVGDVLWAGGVEPDLSLAAGSLDVVVFACEDGEHWLGALVGLDFQAGGNPPSIPALIQSALDGKRDLSDQVVVREARTVAIPDAIVEADGADYYLPPFHASVPDGTSLDLVGMIAQVRDGTCEITVEVDSAPVGDLTEIEVTDTAVQTNLGDPQPIGDGEAVAVVVTDDGGEADNASITLLFDRTVA